MNYIATFCCGFFGGAAPSLLELAGKAQAENLPSGGYYLALAIFGIIGGGIALVYKETVTHKAFLLGVSAPALIVTASTVVDQKTAFLNEILPFSSAYAQDLNMDTKPAAQWATNLDDGKLVVVPIEPTEFGGKFVDTNAQLKFGTGEASGAAQLYNAAEFAVRYDDGTNLPNNPNYWYAVVPQETTSTSLSGSVTTYNQDGALDVWTVETDAVQVPAGGQTVKFSFDRVILPLLTEV